jgi:hypothetical protein
MGTIEYKEILDAITLLWSSLTRNCIPVILNFSLWFIGIAIFYFTLKKIRNNKIEYACELKKSRVDEYLQCAKANNVYVDKTKQSFELLRKSEWIYFYFLLASTAFLLVIEAFLSEIPKTDIPVKSISLFNVVYLLLSILMPQVSRINTYIQFVLTLK